MEFRLFYLDLIKEFVYSVFGNLVFIRLVCVFIGYLFFDVWIEKNGNLVVVGIELVWVEIFIDSVDDYGVYYCVVDNVVGCFKLNYIFEIRCLGLLVNIYIFFFLERG